MSKRKSPTGGTPRRKTTLFCTECGHESGLDGDWIERGPREALACPDCGTVVVAQPTFHVPA